jgi:hypothetical protein
MLAFVCVIFVLGKNYSNQVIPAKAGIHNFKKVVDARLRGHDIKNNP